jgi:hypothetical protein
MAASGLAAGRSPAAGNILALQRLAGNRAVTSALAVQRDGPPGSAAGQVDTAVGGSTAGHELTATATIAGGQTLSNSGGKNIHTVGDTTLRVSVNTRGLSIDFGPSLVITKEDAIGWIDVDIDLHRMSWDFGSQRLHAEWTAANAVNWFGGVGDELFSAFRGALNELPSRTSEPGYNPFTDENLAADLTALVTRLARAGGSGTMPRMSGASLRGEFSVSGELTRSLGHDVTMVVPSGTRLSATAFLTGDVPDSAARVRIGSVRLDASGGGATLNLRALGADFPVIRISSVTMAAGGHLSANYVIVHEDIGTAILQLLAVAQAQANPLSQGEIRDDLTVRDQAAHQLIDTLVRDNIEPVLRDAIRSNADAIPGINLAELLGVSP